MRSNLKSISIFSLIILIFTIQSVVTNAAENAPKKTVTAVKAKRQVFFENYTYPARIDFETLAQVKSSVDGEVVELKVSLGEFVKKGQIISTIKNTDPLFQYKNAKVLSPIDGVVTEVLVSNRSEVTKNQVIIRVANPDNYIITTEIPVVHFNYFKKFPTGELTISNQTTAFPIKMKGMAPQVDLTTGTAEAQFILSNNEQSAQIMPGSFAKVTFKGPEQSGIVISEVALNFKGKKQFVAVVEKNIYKEKEIVIGEKRDGQVLVTSGLNEGELVVERTNGFISNGNAVEIVE